LAFTTIPIASVLLIGLCWCLLIRSVCKLLRVSWRIVSEAGQTATLRHSAPPHDSCVLFVLQRCDLVSLYVLASCHVALAVWADGDASLAQLSIVSFRVDRIPLIDAVAVTVEWTALLREHAVGNGASALVHVRVPVAIAEVIGVAADPGVDATSGRVILVVIEVRALLVRTIHRDCWRVRDFLALCVVLDDLPVVCDGDIDVAEFDLALDLLFNLSQAFPLNRERETVAAARIDVGDDPNVVNVSCNDLLESLQTEFLFVVPEALQHALIDSVRERLRNKDDVAALNCVDINDALAPWAAALIGGLDKYDRRALVPIIIRRIDWVAKDAVHIVEEHEV